MRPTLAVAAAVLLGTAAPVVAKPDHPPKPKPKPPKVELLTKSQDAALQQERIKIGVESKAGSRTHVEAELVVEGIPDDFHFSFPRQSKPLRNHEATVTYRLNRREREVLAFGEQACMRADLNAQAKVGKRVTTIHDQLEKSPEC
jgi:hypothetical protein